MTCPECGLHARESAAFCTGCGLDLLVERKTHAPLSVGTWRPESAQLSLSERTTEPILSRGSPAGADSAPVRPPREAAARPGTPVSETAGSQRAQWIDSVWCSAAGVAR